jgi:outer membrane immunogenic protein
MNGCAGLQTGARQENQVGREMKKALLVGVSLVALGAPAFAADLPARAPAYTKAAAIVDPIYNWSGFYIGLNAAGGSNHNCLDLNGVLGIAIPSVAEGCQNASGALAGGQVGYRWQMTNWVFGLEAEGDWADLKGSNTSAATAPFAIFSNNSKTDALALFTGQIGYAWNNVLWYGKGGAALTHDKYSGVLNSGATFDTASETRFGGAVGTGIEIGFAPGWSVAFEYDHLFMGSRNNSFNFIPPFAPAGATPSRIDNIRQNVDMGTVRVNYTFGGPIVAKY